LSANRSALLGWCAKNEAHAVRNVTAIDRDFDTFLSRLVNIRPDKRPGKNQESLPASGSEGLALPWKVGRTKKSRSLSISSLVLVGPPSDCGAPGSRFQPLSRSTRRRQRICSSTIPRLASSAQMEKGTFDRSRLTQFSMRRGFPKARSTSWWAALRAKGSLFSATATLRMRGTISGESSFELVSRFGHQSWSSRTFRGY